MRQQSYDEHAAGPRDYIDIPPIPASWHVVDIGPGRYPFMRANTFVDHDLEMLRPLAKSKVVIHDRLESGLPSIPDKTYDFCFCSHVLEHVLDLPKSIATLNRIAQRGLVVVPSFVKESIFLFEEPTHHWIVVPHPDDTKPPVFIRHNRAYIDKLRNIDMQQALQCVLRYGVPLSPDIPTLVYQLPEHFKANERHFDIVMRWDEQHPLKVTIIQ